MSRELVSIVIPHFNRSALLRETLSAIKKQSYKNWEVIVVDDGSTDEEWQGIQSEASDGIRLLRREGGEKGPSTCRNLGLAAASGHYVMFVDSDDLLAEWCLETRVRVFEEKPEIDFIVFPVLLFGQNPGDSDLAWNKLEGGDDIRRFLVGDPPWHTSSPIWKRAYLKQTAGFNEKVMYGDDAEFHARILLSAPRYEKVPGTMPDLFIRRGDQARITDSWDDNLLTSRQERLIQGSRMLRRFDAEIDYLRCWEGQYFVEAEELLFNVTSSRRWVKKVLSEWTRVYKPPVLRKISVRIYFWLGNLTRARVYILIRVMRRLMIRLLPAEYFPSGGSYHSYSVESALLESLNQRLAAH